MRKNPYICAPLTELPKRQQASARRFYSRIADVCQEVLGYRAFVPHEHYDPVTQPNFTPQQVDAAERPQVCRGTSVLIVVPLAASWGGGIEVEMANQSNVPVIILCKREKLEQRKVSRLLRGNPAVVAIITYDTQREALKKLAEQLILL